MMVDIFGRAISVGGHVAYQDDGEWFQTTLIFVSEVTAVLRNLVTEEEVTRNPTYDLHYILMKPFRGGV